MYVHWYIFARTCNVTRAHGVLRILVVMEENTKLAICIKPFLENVKLSTKPLRRTTRIKFVNVFVFVSSGKRGDAVLKKRTAYVGELQGSRVEKTT